MGFSLDMVLGILQREVGKWSGRRRVRGKREWGEVARVGSAFSKFFFFVLNIFFATWHKCGSHVSI